MTGVATSTPPFPTRPTGETTLTGAVYRWAEASGVTVPPTDSREETYRFVLRVGRDRLDTRSSQWSRYAHAVIREYMVDVDDDPPPSPQALKLLARLIADAGAMNALRLIAYAVLKGAGLDEQYEADPWRAVLKYAAAVWSREKSEVRR